MIPLNSFAGMTSFLVGALSLISIILASILISRKRNKQSDEQL
jgi:hypothetical protein